MVLKDKLPLVNIGLLSFLVLTNLITLYKFSSIQKANNILVSEFNATKSDFNEKNVSLSNSVLKLNELVNKIDKNNESINKIINNLSVDIKNIDIKDLENNLKKSILNLKDVSLSESEKINETIFNGNKEINLKLFNLKSEKDVSTDVINSFETNLIEIKNNLKKLNIQVNDKKNNEVVKEEKKTQKEEVTIKLHGIMNTPDKGLMAFISSTDEPENVQSVGAGYKVNGWEVLSVTKDKIELKKNEEIRSITFDKTNNSNNIGE